MNTDHYKWGLFYFNPDDTRVIVPKQIQWMGWTLNFARPATWIIIIAFVVVAIFISRIDA